MRTSLVLPAVLLALAVPLLGCSDDGGSDSATDPSVAEPGSDDGDGDVGSAPEPPGSVPAAPGDVRSVGLPTVMDTGGGAQLCLGAVAESYPPQCSGPPITNWDWDVQKGSFDQQGEVRWGTFAVQGTWDGDAITVSTVIPGPLYDPIPQEPVELPEPSQGYSDDELAALAESLADELPGYLGAYPDQEGHVLADVVYDDGTLQAYVDEAYGAGVVVIGGQLVDA